MRVGLERKIIDLKGRTQGNTLKITPVDMRFIIIRLVNHAPIIQAGGGVTEYKILLIRSDGSGNRGICYGVAIALD
ncbi:MAG: hypothetical protein STSR0009_27160 [Methanoregula sp.]